MVEDFTPFGGFVGGLMIGPAVVLLLVLNGRLAGISGILGGLLGPDGADRRWRAAFVAGLVLGASGYVLATGKPPASV